ncbi:MAG: 6-phosphogluconolactonase [Verrucomicrobiae bacterium]|nr:6-phosphogluconolactonase [Verrucomicrobiae bacterium]
MNRKIKILEDSESLARFAAEEIITRAGEAIAAHGFFSLCLSGGSTPRILHRLLAGDPDLRQRMPWSQTYFFFGDERFVPHNHEDSNYRMACETLFVPAEIPDDHVVAIPTQPQEPAAAAREYERKIRTFFESRGLLRNGIARFDLILLGMGPDGHTASLFPDSEALYKSVPWVTDNWVEKFQTHRITLTFPVLNNAATVMFLVAGQDKATVLKEVLSGQGDPLYPCMRVDPEQGDLIWAIDKAAASAIKAS